jgi:hypothetical protein
MRDLDVWYARLDITDLLSRYRSALKRRQVEEVEGASRRRSTKTACVHSRSSPIESMARFGSSAIRR